MRRKCLAVLMSIGCPIVSLAGPATTMLVENAKVSVDSEWQGTRAAGTFASRMQNSIRHSKSVRDLTIVESLSQPDVATDATGTKTITMTQYAYLDLRNTRELPAMLLQFNLKNIECPANLTSCVPTETISVQGPLAVYGSANPVLDIESLLRSKQTMEFRLTSTSTSYKVHSEFVVTSLKFEETISRISREFFGVATSSQITQNKVLTGMASFLRSLNEGTY